MVKDHLHWPPKKRWFNITLDSIFQFWNCCGPFWEICSYTKDIWKEYKLLCDKQYMPLKITKGLWLKWLTLNLGPIVVFFNCKTFINEVLLALVDQMTKDKYVLFVISFCILTTIFNLWMFKRTHNIFVFVLNFLLLEWGANTCHNWFIWNKHWWRNHGHSIADVTWKTWLDEKIIYFVKDERFNFPT